MESTGETVEEISRQIENCDVLNELDDSMDVVNSSISADKSGIEQIVDSATEPSESAVEQASESVIIPDADLVSEQMAEPIPEPVADPATELNHEPATEPAVEPATEPVAEPTNESTVGPIAQPVPEKESTPRSLSHLKLSDLISDTVSLTRSPSQIPDELNTRLFMLNQQINSDTPDTHLIRELLSYHSVPSIPDDYRHGVYCSLLGVRMIMPFNVDHTRESETSKFNGMVGYSCKQRDDS